MNPWGEFAQIFLLFSAGVTGLVFLVKYVAKKWIDAAFAVKMKELDHQYALLQQRENVKYAKTFEARWNAIFQLPYILKDLEQSVTFAHTFLIPVGGKGNLKKAAVDFVYRIPNDTEALGTFIERNGHYFGVEFVGICKTVQERANEYYEPLSGLYQDLEIPLDIAKMEVDRDEFIKSVRKLEQAIREQVGGNIP